MRPQGGTPFRVLATVVLFSSVLLVAKPAAAQIAVLTTPVPGSTLPGASVTFGWTPGIGVTQYFLYLGSALGTNDLFGQSQTSLSVTVSGLPTDGRTIYVRLWSLLAGIWRFNDYTYTAAGGGARFFTITPCRLFDTRKSMGPDAASPALLPSAARIFDASGRCGIPVSAQSLSVNVAIVGPAAPGYLALYPGDGPPPVASTINFMPGQVRTNNALIKLANDGSRRIGVLNGSAGSVDLVLDVNGYFE